MYYGSSGFSSGGGRAPDWLPTILWVICWAVGTTLLLIYIG